MTSINALPLLHFSDDLIHVRREPARLRLQPLDGKPSALGRAGIVREMRTVQAILGIANRILAGQLLNRREARDLRREELERADSSDCFIRG